MRLADTTFVTGPQDALAAVDVYGLQDSSVKNTLVDKTSEFAQGVVGKVRNEVGAAAALGGVFDVVTNAVNDPEEVRKRIEAALELTTLDFQDMGQKVQELALENLGDSLPIPSDLKYVTNGITKAIDTGDFPSARDLMENIQSVIGDVDVVKLFDLGAEAAIFGALANEAIRLGMSELWEALEEKATDSSVVASMSRQSLVQAIRSGDLALVMKLVDKLGWGASRNEEPDLPRQVLRYFKYSTTEDTDYQQEYSTLIGFFDTFDPKWTKISRPGMESSLFSFTVLSNDAHDLLVNRIADSEYRTEAMIAGSYQNLDFEKEFKTYFPNSVL